MGSRVTSDGSSSGMAPMMVIIEWPSHPQNVTKLEMSVDVGQCSYDWTKATI
jgi:hypothetical protein